MTIELFLGLYNYWIVVFLMMTGFYIVIARGNLIKTIIGLNIFQTSVFLLYITMGNVTDGIAPIISEGARHEGVGHEGEHATIEHATIPGVDTMEQGVQPVEQVGDVVAGVVYTNPLPSVLMLTAIVVGIATTALALALIVRIREEYGTIEEDEILEMDRNS